VLARVLKLIVGVALVLAGIAMLVLPGPGLLAIAGGVALVLSQWPRGRRTLASLRLRARERYGSPRVRRVEARIPNEVCPPAETTELEVIAQAPVDPPGTPSLGPPVEGDPGGPVAGPQGRA
jgi:hypothetical protein